jgi:hypothetical protein
MHFVNLFYDPILELMFIEDVVTFDSKEINIELLPNYCTCVDTSTLQGFCFHFHYTEITHIDM